jgi:hypothetical protein
MTNLPVAATNAALIAAEALAYARTDIARYHAGTNPWSTDSPLTAEAGRAVVRHLMMIWASSAEGRMRLVELALGGEPDAAAVLRTLMLEMKSRGLPLTTELQYYSMTVLQRGGVQPAQPPAQKKKQELLRDICIAMTVAALIDRFGLKPTERPPRTGRSACAIVAKALGEAHMQVGYKAVEKIWDRYKNAMPTVPGWAA